VPVIGTVVSTDAAAGTFTANAFVPSFGEQQGAGNAGSGSSSGQGPWGSGLGSGFHGDFWGGSGGGATTPTTTLVTITTNSSTRINVNGSTTSNVGNMKAGDQFLAFFQGSPTDSITTLVGHAALAIFDHTPPAQKQVYAFVGTVTGTDTTAGTVTLTVLGSFPSGLAAAGASVTLTVSANTLILGGTSATGFRNTLANVSTGDIVAGGLLAPQGDTLTQVEALPLQILLDLPIPSTTTTTTTTTTTAATQRALSAALKLLGVKSTSHKTHHHKKHHRKHHSRQHAKKG
jgi:hypothetical protein